MADHIQLTTTNETLYVGQLRILGVGGASVVLIGDTDIISCSSIFDTPPESLIVGSLVPFAPEAGR